MGLGCISMLRSCGSSSLLPRQLFSDLCCGSTFGHGSSSGHVPTVCFRYCLQRHRMVALSVLLVLSTRHEVWVTAARIWDQLPPMWRLGPRDVATVWVEYVDLGIPSWLCSGDQRGKPQPCGELMCFILFMAQCSPPWQASGPLTHLPCLSPKPPLLLLNPSLWPRISCPCQSSPEPHVSPVRATYDSWLCNRVRGQQRYKSHMYVCVRMGKAE